MGILDDAIREHLDLKRRAGAGESELKQLESEAFGPSARPGSPGTEQPAARSEAAVAEIEPPGEGSPTGEVIHTPEAPEGDIAPAESDVHVESGDPTQVDQLPTSFHDFAAEEGLVGSGAGSGTGDLEGPPDPPQPTAPGFEETQPHDIERELAADKPSPADALDLDELDLELDEEEALADNGAVREGGEPEASVEVVEEGTEERVAELDERPAEEPGEGETGEDVLEETPDFLRDTPESDRLWFEQGEPKDFDFEDEEE